ncbi:MAG: hypothetical protein K2M43_01625 [Mycoplasmoidaceae bacterium]|nr:hypothetical protein [Mycoplasmoidaceae bacterium]
MKKAKLIKTISLMSCGLVATGSIPALMTSCSKTDDQYKPQNEQVVFEQMTAQIDAVLTQLSQMISETSAIGDQTKQVCLQVINSFQSTVVKQLKDLSTDPRINVVETMDPLEIFQQVLVFFHAPVMGAISTFFNSYIINKILGHDRAQSYIQLFEDITTNKIDLEIYAKTHWSLTDIFENILYPLCGSAFDEEAARQIA